MYPQPDPDHDLEKRSGSISSMRTSEDGYREKLERVLKWGVETRGIRPVSLEDRTDPHAWKAFMIWLSANLNILSFLAGSLGPLVFGLRFRDSALVIAGFNILCCLIPAYFSTFGPKLGLRQMVQARYSWGYYLVAIPSGLNLVTMMGYSMLNCILGGQTLSSVSGGRLSWNVGIVVIAVTSLFVSFCGYRVLNLYERVAWIPVLVVYLVMIGLGGKHLSDSPPAQPANARHILSFASTTAGYVISWCPLSADFTAYMRPDTSSVKLFLWSYFGLLIPIALFQIVGAAFASSLTAVPEWETGYELYGVGGLIHAVLSPAKGFGDFLTVLMALSVSASVGPTLYSFTINCQVVVPLLRYIPRYIFSVLAIGVVIPLSIVGKTRFYLNLVNFLGLIGYWVCIFGAVVFMEHVVIRRGDFENYDLEAWDQPKKLPSGIAAVIALVGSGALIWAVMDQVWWVGPIGVTTGDIGFEVALVLSGILYVPVRMLERRLTSR